MQILAYFEDREILSNLVGFYIQGGASGGNRNIYSNLTEVEID